MTMLNLVKRKELIDALEALGDAGWNRARWVGKTYGQFWDWFNPQCDAIKAMAKDDEEREQIEAELLELRADLHEGYAGPPEQMGEVIRMHGPPPRSAIDARIEELRAKMPEILAMEEKDQMEAFAGIADEILEDVASEDREHAWSQLQCILRDAGLIPGDDEPCDDR